MRLRKQIKGHANRLVGSPGKQVCTQWTMLGLSKAPKHLPSTYTSLQGFPITAQNQYHPSKI